MRRTKKLPLKLKLKRSRCRSAMKKHTHRKTQGEKKKNVKFASKLVTKKKCNATKMTPLKPPLKLKLSPTFKKCKPITKKTLARKHDKSQRKNSRFY